MAEQLALQQALRQCATINANEALVLTGRQLMDSFSYNFLAGTAFPLDKDRGPCRCHATQGIQDIG